MKWEYKNNAPLWSGVMTTAGGLVFAGTPEGHLKAFNDETGEELWSFQTGSGVVGQPITWEMDGEQFVAVLSGWGGAVPLWGGEVAKKVNFSTRAASSGSSRCPSSWLRPTEERKVSAGGAAVRLRLFVLQQGAV